MKNADNLAAVSRPAKAQLPLARWAKAAACLIFVVFVAAACNNAGLPESYTDQQVLADSGKPPVDNQPGETIGRVEYNWLQGCTVGFEESDLAGKANIVCQCSFDELSSPDGDPRIAFEDFVELNNQLNSDPARLTEAGRELSSTEAELLEIVKNCIATS